MKSKKRIADELELRAAQIAAHAGDHDRARALFAKHGISYVTAEQVARFAAAVEGN